MRLILNFELKLIILIWYYTVEFEHPGNVWFVFLAHVNVNLWHTQTINFPGTVHVTDVRTEVKSTEPVSFLVSFLVSLFLDLPVALSKVPGRQAVVKRLLPLHLYYVSLSPFLLD